MAKVYVSCIVSMPADTVWRIVRSFNALPDWTPFVADSRIEQNMSPDQVGCIRCFTLRNGGKFGERLLALADYGMSCAYSNLESPMGVGNYIAKLSLTPVTDGNVTFAAWAADFDAAPERESELVRLIEEDVFQAAFSHLKTRFRR
jgi:Polyketide cyclase / dehydrase and lipid transport